MTFEELFTVSEIKDVSIMQKNINDDVIATLLQNVKEIEFLPLFKNNFFEDFLQRWSDETQTTTRYTAKTLYVIIHNKMYRIQSSNYFNISDTCEWNC